ncbi:MAG: purine-nucleoside phosphorylase [Kiritimatiellia bacterium]|jgi:purine-nucleoside phosphorylase|nr:purine-nucleoside phosphorylase [Kiritimatiellia bacterium]MDP6629902.1 purine-nucleoside phosphorylase [Kiritimatiellia bacterium]MDP6810570.1 purine-nucleoside phosphorylase [Kiritimatiellia bacterium]MDP7022843.1 purine-nucleoside phosphorylase [Kiritimatiellia bacterium]
MKPINIDMLRSSANAVRERLGDASPSTAAILGSGWGAAIDDWTITDTVAFDQIPMLGAAAVKGHAGAIHLADTGHGTCLVFQGRRHAYGCTSWAPVIFPAFLAHAMGAQALLLTNAAGGIRDDLQPGDLMVIDDHINAMGDNPLRGPHQPDLGPRFPDLTRLYTPALRNQLDAAATEQSISLKHGVYVAVSGPSYETPAEVRAYTTLGADAVGMSTVPEAILAGALGLNVAGLSCITNRAAATGNDALSHDDVIDVTRAATPAMRALVCAFMQRVAAKPHAGE